MASSFGNSPIQGKESMTLTWPAIRDAMISPVQALPTAEPATSQIVYTLQASDFPVISGKQPYSVKYIAFIYAAGNSSGVSGTPTWKPYYRAIVNGVSKGTGSLAGTTGSTNDWSISAYFYYDVHPGDTIELRLWSDTAGLNMDWSGMEIQLTRLIVSPKKIAIADVNLAYATRGTNTSFTGTTFVNQPPNINHDVLSGSLFFLATNKSPFDLLVPSVNSGLMQTYFGDAALSASCSTTTYRPYNLQRNYVPSSISWRLLQGLELK